MKGWINKGEGTCSWKGPKSHRQGLISRMDPSTSIRSKPEGKAESEGKHQAQREEEII